MSILKIKNGNDWVSVPSIKGEKGDKGDAGECAVVEVSSATPVITAEANTVYVCGTVTSLSFTPCASGLCDILFTSGSTITTLTLPNTVKTPDWFDASALEANTVYEINILDGIYGVVAKWAI